MSATRRATRRSCSESIQPAVTLTPRRSSTWRQQRAEHLVDSDEEDIDSAVAKIGTWPTWIGSDELENNENCNDVIKMQRHTRQKNDNAWASVTEVNGGVQFQPQKTPIRNKAACFLPTLRKRAAKNNFNKSGSESDNLTAETHEVSPPKQSRQQSAIDKIPTPTRLIARLSIDEPKTSDDESENEEQQPLKTPIPPASPKSSRTQAARNKYQNARRVLNSAETESLPGREKQLEELRDFLDLHLREKRSASLYVSGQPGTGKTACLSLLQRSPKYIKQMQSVYINCTSIASIRGVYKKLCAELKLQPNGRSEHDYLNTVQKHLQGASHTLLLVLDEIDQLCSSKQSVLYTIFEWPALPGAKLLLVGIANSLNLTERALIRLNAHCELKPRHMHFPPYTKQQIVEIFRSRLEEAGVLDVFPPVTLQLLAAKVSAVSGDVRRALDIGRRVAEIAEQQMKSGQREMNLDVLGLKATVTAEEAPLKPVQVTHVAAVLNKVYGASQNLHEDIEDSFPLQQKIMLCTLLLILRKERKKDISIGRIHEVYRRICSKRNIHALGQGEFVGLIDLVETRGILSIQRKKEPRLSKVILQWDEEEINGALRDKQLIASILDDASCLAK